MPYGKLRSNPLLLYRKILQRKKNFTYTDKEYYAKWIRDEFEKNSKLKDPEEIRYVINQGIEFLKNGSMRIM